MTFFTWWCHATYSEAATVPMIGLVLICFGIIIGASSERSRRNRRIRR